jgi:hypothetical protein
MPDLFAIRRSRLTALGRATAVFLLAWAASAFAQPGPPPRDSAVKAAFLYKFPGFVDWPAGSFARPDAPLVIGVAGNEAVASDLEQIVTGRTLEGRPVAVRRLREGETPAGVHVLLVGAGRDTRVRETVAAVPGPVLVITEQENGLQFGSVLNFVVEEGRVRFAASQAAAEARGLRLSARLLAVAQSVDGRTR